MTTNLTPDLLFGPGDLSGFTPAGIAGFHSLKPAAVVRELLQNSLDAAREAGREVVRVRFEVEKHSLQDIPGLSSYREAFQKAVDDQTRKLTLMPVQADAVVSTIRDCLKKSTCHTLYVMDNGIGLDEKRMGGLLADGLSVKGDTSTGAVGNGHMVVLPASDLRYVLYGGRQDTGEATAAGHAVLASHEIDGERKSKDGFYVKELKNELEHPYVFPLNGEIPEYIGKKLAWIQNNWEPGAGAVVAVPGFNYFREEGENSLWEMVSKAAASSFFAAFGAGELSVEVVENGETQTLNQGTIHSVLRDISGEKRTRSGFLSGRAAFNAYEAMTLGEKITVSTEVGTFTVCLKENQEGGASRIDLCRNGMWITNRLPRLGTGQFAELKAFHAVILLDIKSGDLHRIIRKAEGPLHNDIDQRKWLTPEEKAGLWAAMKSIAQAIKERTPELSDERFKADSVLAVQGGFASGGRRAAKQGNLAPVKRRQPAQTRATSDDPEAESWNREGDQNDSDSPNPEWSQRRFSRQGKSLRFSALPVPINTRNWRVSIKSDEECRDSELRFILDESVDESSSESVTDVFVKLRDIKIEHQAVSKEQLIKNDKGDILGVRLGALAIGQEVEVQFACEAETDIVGSEAPMVLKTQLVQRAPDPVVREESKNGSE